MKLYTKAELKNLSNKELDELEKETSQLVNRLDTTQKSIKIFLNSIYGTFANRHSPFFDIDAAKSITLTGQACVKQSSVIVQEYAEKYHDIEEELTVYGDTDSVVGDTIVTTNIGDLKIEDIYNEYAQFNSPKKDEHGHEILPCANLQSLTYDSSTDRIILGEVKNIIRHKVSKRKFAITVGDKTVVMTEDHGCMVRRNGELIRVSPKDILPTDKMIVKKF